MYQDISFLVVKTSLSSLWPLSRICHSNFYAILTSPRPMAVPQELFFSEHKSSLHVHHFGGQMSKVLFLIIMEFHS